MKADRRARGLLRLAAAVGVVGTVAAVPVILSQPSSQNWAGELAEQASAEKPAFVRVEHEFVTLDADPDAPPEVAPSRPPAPVPVLARRTPLTKPEPRLTQKTRRALLGDGRHRPEPFPRVREP